MVPEPVFPVFPVLYFSLDIPATLFEVDDVQPDDMYAFYFAGNNEKYFVNFRRYLSPLILSFPVRNAFAYEVLPKTKPKNPGLDVIRAPLHSFLAFFMFSF